MLTTTPTRRSFLAAAALTLAVLATGCSDADNGAAATAVPESSVATETDPGATSDPQTQDLATFLTECMHAEGIADFPDATELPNGTLDLDAAALDEAGIGPGTAAFNEALANCETEAGQPIELGDHTNQFTTDEG